MSFDLWNTTSDISIASVKTFQKFAFRSSLSALSLISSSLLNGEEEEEFEEEAVDRFSNLRCSYVSSENRVCSKHTEDN